MDDSDQWIGSVVRSALDSRVWVAVMPDTDTMTGAMGASTSLRKCKHHVANTAAHWLDADPSEVRWERSTDGSWEAYL